MRKLTMSKASMNADPILKVGLRYYRDASRLFFLNLASLLLLYLGLLILNIAVLAFMVCSYTFWWKYRSWEKKNKEYLNKLGFDVR